MENNSKNGRIYRIDNIKAVLITLVVIGHFYLPLMGRTRFLTSINLSIYSFHMPAFIFISGLLSKSLYKNGKFRWNKLIYILGLYLFYEIIVFFSEIPAYGKTSNFPDFFHESGAPWYLLALFFYYMIVPILYRISNKFNKLIFFIFSIIISAISGYLDGFLNLSDFLSLDRVFTFLPFFIGGYFLGIEEFSRIVVRHRKVLSLSFIVLFTFIFINAFTILYPFRLFVYGAWYGRIDKDAIGNLLLRNNLWLIRCIWIVIAFILSFGLFSIIPEKKFPIISRLGRKTLQIYIIHRPIRDLLLYSGFIGSFNIYSKLSVIELGMFSILLTYILSIPNFGKILRR